MNDPEKRICPFCAEIIQNKAKVCPRCRQWLTWKSSHHPAIGLWAHLVPLAVLSVLIFTYIERFQNPKPYYSEFPNSLKILSSQMNWVETKEGLRIYLTGVSTNTSGISWKDVEFDCRFFDAHGTMLDAGPGRSYMTVLPYDDAAFRVAMVPIAPTNQYASFKIRIGNARNAKGRF